MKELNKENVTIETIEKSKPKEETALSKTKEKESKRNRKEPPFRIAKRNNVTWKNKLLAFVGCVGGAVLISIFFLWAVSMANPLKIVGTLFQGTFGNSIKFWASLKKMVILLAISLALTPAYKMRFWNVGAQGQILMGALMCAVSMKYLSDLPTPLIIISSMLVAALGGALWGYIPSIFKARWNTNETLFTLMMNYLAILLVTFATDNWKGDHSSMGSINPGTKAGWIPTPNLGRSVDGSVLLPLLLVALLMVGMFFYIRSTKHGYEIQVVGQSISTARYTGIDVRHVIRRTMALSGAICGLVGFFYVAGFDHTISPSTSGGYGFTAVIVCWLASFNPFMMAGYSFLIIFLNDGARNLSNTMVTNYPALNEYSTQLVIFLIIIAIMLTSFFTRYRIVKTRHTDDERILKEATQGGSK